MSLEGAKRLGSWARGRLLTHPQCFPVGLKGHPHYTRLGFRLISVDSLHASMLVVSRASHV